MWRAPLSGFPQGEAHDTCDHHTPDDSISYPDMLSGLFTPMFRCPSMVCPDALSGHLLPWIPKNSPQSRITLLIKKAIKTPKLNTIWLELIARVFNMLIGLKGDNYYSKVFKRFNYKLSNSTFWVVIIEPLAHDPYSFMSTTTQHCSQDSEPWAHDPE